MSNILKNPYEISVWEDRLSSNKKYYEEVKIAIIGSETMDTPIRAYNPILTKNLNGTSVLKFILNSQYYDSEAETFLQNPYVNLLTNETKIKLRYKGEWLDLIIKNIEENSRTKQFEYEATDIFINELAKSGFSIELAPELYNNQGTITELAETVVSGTDWQIGESEIIHQYIKEPLYRLTLKSNIQATDALKNSSVLISAGKYIYAFHSCLIGQTPYFQFLYSPDGNLPITQDYLLDLPNLFVDSVTYVSTHLPEFFVPTFAEHPHLETDFRGERLVRQQFIIIDHSIEKVVSLYRDSANQNKLVYGFTSFEAADPIIVQNYITNPKNYTSIDGWEAEGENPIELKLLQTGSPPIDYTQDHYMGLSTTAKNILNKGLFHNRNQIKDIPSNTEFIMGIRQKNSSGVNSFSGRIAAYTLNTAGQYIFHKTYVTFSPYSSLNRTEIGYYTTKQYYKGVMTEGLSHEDLVLGVSGSGYNNAKIGFFLTKTGTGEAIIEDLELFLGVKQGSTYLLPGQVPEISGKPTYFYYYPDENIKQIEDVTFLYKGKDPSPLYVPIYDESYEKIRSITISKSNRFNIIQTLCETFRCWAKFTIEHENDGRIKRNSQGKLLKTISFHNFIGQDNYAGFKYGINLPGIRRTLVSDQIVTKLIVENNSNEFGKNGFTTIARAYENPTKENFILNFDYFIQQGLLSYSELVKDLYGAEEDDDYLNYFGQLYTLNLEQEELINKQTSLINQMINLDAELQANELVYEEAKRQLNQGKQTLNAHTGYTYSELVQSNPPTKIKTILKEEAVQDLLVSIRVLNNQIEVLDIVVDSIYLAVGNSELQWKNTENRLKTIREDKENLHNVFFNKYSYFIQEGTWISEDYIDDNLYYFDAENILHSSAFPQVNYTIDVLDLSPLEEYKNYSFQLGDKTYIEDTEFFGYYNKGGLKTPYQEEVVISEITYDLDDLAKNQIKVQNYKTQFEDLFQRITAATQSLQMQAGEYQRAARMIKEDGTIDSRLLQNAFANNAFILSNIRDQSVTWGDQGITIQNLREPSQIIRLVSGGVFITSDGGEEWSAAITGDGINARFLTTGQIDASRVNIIGGLSSAFRWDQRGLTAYSFTRDPLTQVPRQFDFTKFVRFDQYGIYGYNGNDSFVPVDIDDVIENTNFSLTWKGLRLYGTDGVAMDGDEIINNITDIQAGKITLSSQTVIEDELRELLTNREVDSLYYIYHTSTSNTAPPSSLSTGWSTTRPNFFYQQDYNKYLWLQEIMLYDDESFILVKDPFVDYTWGVTKNIATIEPDLISLKSFVGDPDSIDAESIPAALTDIRAGKITLSTNTILSSEVAATLKGDPGPKGDPGVQGNPGAQGSPGAPGTPGVDGREITSQAITYAISTNKTNAPSTGWSSTRPTFNYNSHSDSVLWKRTIATYNKAPLTETTYEIDLTWGITKTIASLTSDLISLRAYTGNPEDIDATSIPAALTDIRAGQINLSTRVSNAETNVGIISSDYFYLSNTVSNLSNTVSGYSSSITSIEAGQIALSNQVNGVVGDITTISNGMAQFTIKSGGTTYIDGGMIRTNTLKATGVEITGKITATSGKIGGFDLTSNYMETDGPSNYVRISGHTGLNAIQVGMSSSDIRFRVTNKGVLTCTGADIAGKVTATTGKIGAYTIYSSYLGGGNVTLYKNSISIGSASISVGSSSNIIAIDGLLRGGPNNPSAALQSYSHYPRVGNESTLGAGSYRWKYIYLNNSPDVSSDIRLKSDIVDIPDNLLDHFEEVKPRSYMLNGKNRFGYIAQDVETAFYKYTLKEKGYEAAKSVNEGVGIYSKSVGDGMMGLVYEEIAVLKEAELQRKIKRLEARIIALEKAQLKEAPQN